jgi:membrane protein implicated in regulation of membrane protease activity
VIDRILSIFKAEYQSVLTTLICAAVAAMAGVVAILFTGVAIFIWASDRYGSLAASIAMACFFLAVALIAVVVLLIARSKAAKRALARAEREHREREEAAKNAPPIWADPSLIPTLLPMLLPVVLKVGQIGIKHRGLLLAALSSAVVGWGLLRERGTPQDEMPAAEQPAE